VAVVHAPPPARLFRCTGFSLFPCARIGPEAGPLGFVPPPVQPLDRTNAACRGNGCASHFPNQGAGIAAARAVCAGCEVPRGVPGLRR
jgi:hypothetical protein